MYNDMSAAAVAEYVFHIINVVCIYSVIYNTLLNSIKRQSYKKFQHAVIYFILSSLINYIIQSYEQ